VAQATGAELESQSEPNEGKGCPPIKQTPAMAAGVADHAWSVTEIAQLLD
jgi:hypothetical protein